MPWPPSPIINVIDVAFVRFHAPDLDRMEAFLVDFGLIRSERTDDTLYMRGTDDEGFIHVTHLAEEPGFAGLAFNAESADDLETLSLAEGFGDVAELGGSGRRGGRFRPPTRTVSESRSSQGVDRLDG